MAKGRPKISAEQKQKEIEEIMNVINEILQNGNSDQKKEIKQIVQKFKSEEEKEKERERIRSEELKLQKDKSDFEKKYNEPY